MKLNNQFYYYIAKKIIFYFLILLIIYNGNVYTSRMFAVKEIAYHTENNSNNSDDSENLKKFNTNNDNKRAITKDKETKSGASDINFKFSNVTLIVPSPLEEFRTSTVAEQMKEEREISKDKEELNDIDEKKGVNMPKMTSPSDAKHSLSINNKNEKSKDNKNQFQNFLIQNSSNNSNNSTSLNASNSVSNNKSSDIDSLAKNNYFHSQNDFNNVVPAISLGVNKRLQSIIPHILESNKIIVNKAALNLNDNNSNKSGFLSSSSIGDMNNNIGTINLRTANNAFFNQVQGNNYNANSVDISKMSYQCAEIGCEWCDKNNTKNCKQCKHGFFMYMSKCYTICPKEYIADIYSRTCTTLDNTNVYNQISYVKSFSLGSCKNLCGKTSIDCNCTRTCINEGNCCADYQVCESLYKINHNRNHECYKGNPNCDLCENFVARNDPSDMAKIIPYKCGKCREGFFLKYGECREKCGSKDKIIAPNNICFDTMNCLVENCAQCAQENSAVCRTCSNGTFMHNNQCLRECPGNLRADRISWTCVEAPNAAWYWTWPSKSSCRLRCGRKIDFEMDCSCETNCYTKGNCCVDWEDYCPQFVFWK